MRVDVGGGRIFFDVEGAKFVPSGPIMREKPTLILLHGGPGMDHAHFLPAFSQFAEIAQVVYVDHRGHGRSDYGDPSLWNLAQWGDDVRDVCDALEIVNPVVLGQSFGGLVAMSYATRHPLHPGKLILASTQPRFERARSLAVFERLGGAEARDVAGRFFNAGDGASLAEYARVCLPLYARRKPADSDTLQRCIQNPAVLAHYFGPGGEASTIDLRAGLSRITCPTLILAGEDDPIAPVESSDEMASIISPHLVKLVRYGDTGHTVFDDEPRSFEAVHDFILA
jgi:proline iminopeptidase